MKKIAAQAVDTAQNAFSAHRSGWAAALLWACAAGLTGCALPLPDKPARPATYDFGPATAPTTPTDTAPQASAIALPPVTAPAVLDTQAVLYRLAYAGHAQQLRPYAQARWSMTPADLFSQRLHAALAAIRPVVPTGEGLAPVELRVHLDEFSQVFDAPGQSHARLRLRATAIAPQAAQRLLGQRSFSVQRPAATADAPGGARALAEASDAAIAELTGWLAQLQLPATAAPSAAAPATPSR
ncbi:hypothetical protein EII20_03360 [Comamonadaceae bacterium OH2545_COT-014]|nr:hypothetical protein EII20_03360 [Comamonadaceae bacterium OH2545_COT-014]